MQFEQPTYLAKFLRRYKRFFVDLELDGELITAHCPNTGSMRGCLKEGMDCLLRYHQDPKRKLAYSLELCKPEQHWILVNTSRTNAIVEERLRTQPLPPAWQSFDGYAREVKINAQTRLDFALWRQQDFAGQKPKVEDLQGATSFHFIEVKNVSYAEDGCAMFPDARSERGQKHLQELIQLQQLGHSTEILFLIAREDCHSFAPAKHIDAEYAALLQQAFAAGVSLRPVKTKIDGQQIRLLDELLPIVW